MSTIQKIRDHIAPLQDDDLFTTRGLLHLAERRGSIDNALYLMVKSGELIRQAYGVFCKGSCMRKFTIFEIAEVKARAFFRKMVQDAETVAATLKMMKKEHDQVAFAISGNSSSFRCLVANVRVHFKGICERKMRMGDHHVGQKLRAFWQAGPDYTIEHFKEVLLDLVGPDVRHAYQFIPCVPHWMSDQFADLQR